MGILDSIAAVFGGKEQTGRDTRRTYIVDGERLAGGREGSDRISPVERVQMLQRLGRFAAREELRMEVVLVGRPLREVGHGDDYSGLKVYYAEQPSKLGEEMAKLVRQARGRGTAVVITADRALEGQMREAGAETMRISTLRKGIEGPESEGDQGRQQQQRRRRPQQRREREGQQQQQQAAQPSEAQQGAERPSPSRSSDPTVNNLIDLVE
jgi:hypothetical protein